MKKHHKKPAQHFDPRPEDLHLAFGEMRDPAAWAESVEIDAAGDRDWLQSHPEAEYRERLISPREVRITGNPPGTIVLVGRGPSGTQLRAFLRA